MTEPFVRPVTVTDFLGMHDFIYADANKRFSDEKLISLLCQTATLGVLKNARKHRESLLLNQIPDINSRAFAVANRLGIDLEAALRFKFPGVCSSCLETEGCRCLFRKADERGGTPEGQRILQELRARKDGWPESFRAHQLFHDKLYGRQHELFDLFYLSARLVEETAEVAEAYYTGRKEDLALELADVFSWNFAICNRVNMEKASHEFVYIDDLHWNYYPYACRKCRRNVCCGLCGDKTEFLAE